MSLPSFSIQRHVFTLMASVVLLLFGVIGLMRLGIDKFPKIEFPAVSVVTTLQGADPEIIDKNITDILEESINQVPGVKSIVSSSSIGRLPGGQGQDRRCAEETAARRRSPRGT